MERRTRTGPAAPSSVSSTLSRRISGALRRLSGGIGAGGHKRVPGNEAGKTGYGRSARRFNRRFAAAALLAGLAVPGAPAPGAETLRLLAFGDSLTSGYGLAAEDAFPARLEAALRAAGRRVRVVDAGLAGDTSSGGRARLAWSLEPRPDAVIVELGANDGLRGIDPAVTEANLDAILGALKRRALPVLFAGMYAPPNLGRDYGAAFDALFPRLAARHGVAFYPFFLDGVAARPELNQADGIHPNARGVAVIVARILPHVLDILP